MSRVEREMLRLPSLFLPSYPSASAFVAILLGLVDVRKCTRRSADGYLDHGLGVTERAKTVHFPPLRLHPSCLIFPTFSLNQLFTLS